MNGKSGQRDILGYRHFVVSRYGHLTCRQSNKCVVLS